LSRVKKGSSKGVKKTLNGSTRKEESALPYEKCGERTGRDQYYVVKHRTWYAGISLIGAEFKNCP